MFGKKDEKKDQVTRYVVEVYMDNFIDRDHEMLDGTFVKIGRHAWGWMIWKFYGEEEHHKHPIIFSENSRGFDTSDDAYLDLMVNLKRIQREDGYRA